MRELELALEKMSRAVVDKKQELEQEVLSTQAAQIQLDKAAEDFRCEGRAARGPAGCGW